MILPVYVQRNNAGRVDQIGSFEWRYLWEPGGERRFDILEPFPMIHSERETVQYRTLILRMGWVCDATNQPTPRSFFGHINYNPALFLVVGSIADLVWCRDFDPEGPPFRSPPPEQIHPLSTTAAASQSNGPQTLAEMQEYIRHALSPPCSTGDADITPPDFTKPLAPLPEWLEKVDAILKT